MIYPTPQELVYDLQGLQAKLEWLISRDATTAQERERLTSANIHIMGALNNLIGPMPKIPGKATGPKG
jgi:hypothetical protein